MPAKIASSQRDGHENRQKQDISCRCQWFGLGVVVIIIRSTHKSREERKKRGVCQTESLAPPVSGIGDASDPIQLDPPRKEAEQKSLQASTHFVFPERSFGESHVLKDYCRPKLLARLFFFKNNTVVVFGWGMQATTKDIWRRSGRLCGLRMKEVPALFVRARRP